MAEQQEHLLFHRVSSDPNETQTIGGQLMVTSAAMRTQPSILPGFEGQPEVSVESSRFTTVAQTHARDETFTPLMTVAIPADALSASSFTLIHSPMPDNHAHHSIIFKSSGTNQTKRLRQILARLANDRREFYIPAADPIIEVLDQDLTIDMEEAPPIPHELDDLGEESVETETAGKIQHTLLILAIGYIVLLLVKPRLPRKDVKEAVTVTQ